MLSSFADNVQCNSSSTVKINREVISIRGIVEGEYIVNAHFYSKRLWVEMISLMLIIQMWSKINWKGVKQLMIFRF